LVRAQDTPHQRDAPGAVPYVVSGELEACILAEHPELSPVWGREGDDPEPYLHVHAHTLVEKQVDTLGLDRAETLLGEGQVLKEERGAPSPHLPRSQAAKSA